MRTRISYHRTRISYYLTRISYYRTRISYKFLKEYSKLISNLIIFMIKFEINLDYYIKILSTIM